MQYLCIFQKNLTAFGGQLTREVRKIHHVIDPKRHQRPINKVLRHIAGVPQIQGDLEFGLYDLTPDI